MLFYFVTLVTWVNAVVWDRVVETGTWNEMLPGGWHRPGRRRFSLAGGTWCTQGLASHNQEITG